MLTKHNMQIFRVSPLFQATEQHLLITPSACYPQIRCGLSLCDMADFFLVCEHASLPLWSRGQQVLSGE